MAQLIGLRAYQINSQDPIPLGSTPVIDFPFSGIVVRGTPGGFALSNGVVCYSQVQLLATGTQYAVLETSASIVASS